MSDYWKRRNYEDRKQNKKNNKVNTEVRKLHLYFRFPSVILGEPTVLTRTKNDEYCVKFLIQGKLTHTILTTLIYNILEPSDSISGDNIKKKNTLVRQNLILIWVCKTKFNLCKDLLKHIYDECFYFKILRKTFLIYDSHGRQFPTNDNSKKDIPTTNHHIPIMNLLVVMLPQKEQLHSLCWGRSTPDIIGVTLFPKCKRCLHCVWNIIPIEPEYIRLQEYIDYIHPSKLSKECAYTCKICRRNLMSSENLIKMENTFIPKSATHQIPNIPGIYTINQKPPFWLNSNSVESEMTILYDNILRDHKLITIGCNVRFNNTKYAMDLTDKKILSIIKHTKIELNLINFQNYHHRYNHLNNLTTINQLRTRYILNYREIFHECNDHKDKDVFYDCEE